MTPILVGPWFENFAQWHYAAVLVFCLAVTAPLELVIGARVYRHPKRLAATIAIASAPFVLWDLLAIRAGHWWFSDEYTLDVHIGSFPIEELAFFVVIPIAALLTHETVKLLLGDRKCQ